MVVIKYSLFYSPLCYYCQKVLSYLQANKSKGQHDSIELLNLMESDNMATLRQGGGKTQVPCLRIENDNHPTQWLYESDDIIAFLKESVLI